MISPQITTEKSNKEMLLDAGESAWDFGFYRSHVTIDSISITMISLLK